MKRKTLKGKVEKSRVRQKPHSAGSRKPLKRNERPQRPAAAQKHPISPQKEQQRTYHAKQAQAELDKARAALDAAFESNDTMTKTIAASITPMLDSYRERMEREIRGKREKKEEELLDLQIEHTRKQLADTPAAPRSLTDEELKKMKAVTHRRAGEQLGGITDRTVRLLIKNGTLNKTGNGKTAIDEKFFLERARRLNAKT
jgi:hypothetical protein